MTPLVLILCTGNSCRSQMAEAFLRAAAGGVVEVGSAGSHPSGYVHPLAIRVMAEAGFDLSGARSKPLDEFAGRAVDTLITVCSGADRSCPGWPGVRRRHHWGFDDPGAFRGDEEATLAEFRRVRDEIGRVFGAYGAGLADRLPLAGP